MAVITSYNPFVPEVKENPYPAYEWLRREHPVYHNEELGFWVLSRYADVEAAARRPEIFSSAQGVGPDRQEGASMITKDPPEHTRLRKLVSKAFTPRMVSQLEPHIRAITDELLDAVIDKGAFDLVQDLAYPLPVIVIAEMLGVDPERRDDFKRWSDDVIHIVAAGQNEARMAQYMESWEAFKAYFVEMIEVRRRAPRDDLVSALVQAQEERDALTLSELLNACLLLLVAGNETTTNLIGNGALALFTHVEEGLKMRQQPEFISGMIEEVLRYDSPIQGTFRTTTEAVDVRSVTIPADSKVLLLWASANRDAEVFPDPDRFDIERPIDRHLAFGIGIHFCLGAPLARLEARIATETILRRMHRVEPDPNGTIERVDNPFFRGLKHYPLLFEPTR